MTLGCKRLVDDINMVIRRKAVNHDDGIEPLDERNMEFVREVANNIHTSIQVTNDFPSKNVSKKMPILDLRVWTANLYNEITQEEEYNIMHEYFYKEVASRAVIDARSAVPWKMKRTVLTQEIVRILRNGSRKMAME